MNKREPVPFIHIIGSCISIKVRIHIGFRMQIIGLRTKDIVENGVIINNMIHHSLKVAPWTGENGIAVRPKEEFNTGTMKVVLLNRTIQM